MGKVCVRRRAPARFSLGEVPGEPPLPGWRRFALPRAPALPPLRSAANAPAPAGARAFAAAPALPPACGALYGGGDSGVPKGGVFRCGCVRARLRRSGRVGLFVARGLAQLFRLVESCQEYRISISSAPRAHVFNLSSISPLICSPSCTVPVTRMARVSYTRPPYLSYT